MKNIVDILNENKRISAYKVVEQHTDSYELFFVKDKLETVRNAESNDCVITVYVDHDGKRGNSAFAVYASSTEDDLREKIDKAVDKALLVNDAYYDLPCNETLVTEIESNISCEQAKTLGAKIAHVVFEASVLEDCEINALEVFVVARKTHVLNSLGIDKTQTKHTVSIEAIPTCNGKNESVELFETYTLAEFDEDWLTKEIHSRMLDVKARLVAERPQYEIHCPVILNAYEINQLFGELVYDRDFALEYKHQNFKNVGDKLQENAKGDLLTITMRGEITGNPHSAKFDADGTALKDAPIVKDGVIIGGFGSNRFAQYLRKEPTGALGCIDIDCGNTSIKDMQSVPHLECVYLSGLQVDVYNDYIGGEIRLAYYFDGKNRTPLTGISMSGKLSEVLDSVVLSKEKVNFGAYRGPEKIMLDCLSVF